LSVLAVARALKGTAPDQIVQHDLASGVSETE
jgi:hypothetical protein